MSTETINNLNSANVLGYYESIRSVFYVKLGVLGFFEAGNITEHQTISNAASEMALALGMNFDAAVLGNISEEVVDNLKEDAITALIVSSWNVFEQVIKDLASPGYASSSVKLNADFYKKIFGYTQPEIAEIEFFYHLRNAIAHYNGTYHAYKMVDVSYNNRKFKSDGHIGEKIEVDFPLAFSISNDLEKYAMQAWSAAAQPAGRS